MWGGEVGSAMVPVRSPRARSVPPSLKTLSVAVTAPYAPPAASQRVVLEDFPDAKLARQLSPNGRSHWAVRDNARKKAAMRIAGGCIVYGLRPVSGPVSITLRWVFPRQGRHDLDNLIATSKSFVDALVRGKYLVDDSSDHVVNVRAEVVIEKGRRALEIVIEPVALAADRED